MAKLPRNERQVYLYMGIVILVLSSLLAYPTIKDLISLPAQETSTGVVDTSEKQVGPEVVQEDAGLLEEIKKISVDIVGKWESTADKKFTREFTQDVVIDGYDAVTVTSDPYEITTHNPLKKYGVSFPAGVYITMGHRDSPLIFRVISLSDDILQLSNASHGNTLEFRRVK